MRFNGFIGLFLAAMPVMALQFDLNARQVLPNNPLLGAERSGLAIRSVRDTLPPPRELTALRKKITDTTYALFYGRLKTDAWKLVSVYHNEQRDLWGLFTTARFFSRAPLADSAELPQVLWHDGLLLVPGSGDTLYAQTPQDIVVLIAAPDRPALFTIDSPTPEARAYIDGKELGPCPQTIRWLKGSFALLRIEAPGHQSWESLVIADKNTRTASIRQPLIPLPTQVDGWILGSPADLSAHDSWDYHRYKNEMLSMIRGNLNPAREHMIMAMSDWLDTLKNRLYVEYISPSHLSVLPWDSTIGGLPVRLWYGQNDFDFGFEGYIPCNIEDAYALEKLLRTERKNTTLKFSSRSRRLSWPSTHTASSLDGTIRLYYRNWKTSVRTNNRHVQRYYALDRLEIVLEDRVIPLSGEFIPAGYVRNSADWKEFIHAFQRQ